MPNQPRRRAFTTLDLLAVVAILLFAAALLPAQLLDSRENASRARCANNLRSIGLALRMYPTSTYGGAYPRGPYKPEAPLTQYTAKVNDGNIFGGDVADNDCTVALLLLLRQDMDSNVMICPSTFDIPDTFGASTNTANNRSNITSPDNLSYSFQCPYPPSRESTFVWKDGFAINADFAIASDKNPGVDPRVGSNVILAQLTGPAIRAANSRNHRGDGQNVVYGDVHVQWTSSPLCGRNDDNIFVYGASPIRTGGKCDMAAGAGPADDRDSYLLPAASFEVRPATTGPSNGGSRKSADNALTTILIISGIVAAAAVAAWYRNKKRNWAPPMVGG